MTGLLVVFVVLTVLAAAGSVVIALLAWQRRSVPGALCFVTVMAAAGFWCAAYAAEICVSSLTAKLFFERLTYVGVVVVPPSWLLFSLLYSGVMRRRSALTLAPFYLMPLATMACVVLAPALPLFWRHVGIVTVDGVRELSFQYGPWFWVHWAYSYACLAGGSIVLLATVFRRVRPLNGQGLAFVAAVALPAAVNALTLFHLLPHALGPLTAVDLTPPAIAASAALVALGLSRLQMFDVFPALIVAAHDALMGELRDGVLVIDGHDRVLEANRAAQELLAPVATTPVGRPLTELLAGEALVRGALSDLDAAGQGSFETTVLAANGSQRHLEITVSRQGSSRRADGHVLVLHDVSERVAATLSLQRQSQRLHVLFEQSPVGVMVFDCDLVVTECNQRFATVIRMAHEDIIGHCLDTASLLAFYQAALRGETASYNGPYTLRTSGVEVWLAGEVSPLTDEAGVTTGGIAVVRDVTESKRAEQLIERLAFSDTLTGLANRTVFRDRLRQAIAQAARSAADPLVVILDLDRFKTVNETLTHALADRLLQAVGERLQAVVRQGDTVARWGGDEFAVLQPGSRDIDGFALVERLKGCFAEPWQIDAQEVWLTASIGLAAYPADGDDAQALLESAEAAMQAAKKLGGNGYRFYAPAQNGGVEDSLALIGALHRALEEEQFVVYYQPQIDLATMCVVGCEALVRWQHPERGLVAPVTFIPLAEESGLMQPIGEWVLRQACAQAAAWEREFHNQLRVGVNLSARQFQQSGLTETVASALDEAGLPARLLELEVTETAILADPEAAAGILSEVAKMGISIALDDFGTGYSSLSHLRQLPIDRLKIDRSFVSRLPNDADDRAITAAVIDMARNLGLRVIAEGVETWQQVAFLRAGGCHEVQGYLFGKPVPAQDFTLVPADETVSVGAARKPQADGRSSRRGRSG